MSNNETGRKIIAALSVSVDGFIEGPNGEMDWVMMEDDETWRDLFEMLTHVDTFILGIVMYPVYEQYWLAVLADPDAILPLSGRVASKNEIAFAHLADSRQHLVLSRTMDKVAWKTTRVVRDVDEIRKMKQQPGKDMYAVGGAMLVSSLMNLGLVDEVKLLVNPLILGGGKALFKDVKDRHALKLVQAKPFKSGRVSLTYVTQPEKM
jgi:dihydrofolate reductase